ncbi:glycosyltransferase [Acanthopleuribacter pedis]|uniref:Glycosyltransferase n=1 Tax=Acanthopleuribacter pedis TaxID=442870 RepID=A0A8J7Q0A0_9BACT|nr:glycosyltransferase [Acanthopleuribacter pedis]MBO1318037.1 glycosyltransferase [Acanthopleuribacter pedis]
MQQRLLTICIPTYNRVDLLTGTIQFFFDQITSGDLTEKVAISITDNASTDETPQRIAEMQQTAPCPLLYHRNETNLGFDRNVVQALKGAETPWVWTCGDYNRLFPDAIRQVCEVLQETDPEVYAWVAPRGIEFHPPDRFGNHDVSVYTIFPNRPLAFDVPAEDMLSVRINMRGMNDSIFNREKLWHVLEHHQDQVAQGVGLLYMHAWLQGLVALHFPHMRCRVMNRNIILMVKVDRGYNPVDQFFDLSYLGNMVFYRRMVRLAKAQGFDKAAGLLQQISDSGYLGFLWVMIGNKMVGKFSCHRPFHFLLRLLRGFTFKRFLQTASVFLLCWLLPRRLLDILLKLYFDLTRGAAGRRVLAANIQGFAQKSNQFQMLKYSAKSWMGQRLRGERI